jgi:hypothetical protein
VVREDAVAPAAGVSEETGSAAGAPEVDGTGVSGLPAAAAASAPPAPESDSADAPASGKKRKQQQPQQPQQQQQQGTDGLRMSNAASQGEGGGVDAPPPSKKRHAEIDGEGDGKGDSLGDVGAGMQGEALGGDGDEEDGPPGAEDDEEAAEVVAEGLAPLEGAVVAALTSELPELTPEQIQKNKEASWRLW